MHTNTINTTQSTTPELHASTRFVRSQGAADAHGFAQFMQAFETDSDSSAIESESHAVNQHEDSGSDQVAKDNNEITDASEDSVGSGEQEETGGGSSSQSESATDSSETDESEIDVKAETQSNDQSSPSAQGVDDSVGDTETQPTQAQPVHSVEGTQANEVAFRLLENQSEQAKLSIKGVMRTLTHAADANLSSIAVNTRLGKEQQSSVQNNQTPTETAPDQTSRSHQSNGEEAVRNSQVSNTAQPHQQIAQSAEPIRVPENHSGSAQQIPVDAKPDQFTVDVQQVRSQRIDASTAIAGTNSTIRTSVEQSANQGNQHLQGINRAQTTQAVRGVSGTESGNVGQQQTQTGQMAERMKATELPTESKRAAVLAQVQRGLASLLRSGNGEMTLKLTPGHLGEVRIRIKSTGDQLGVRFETSSSEATELLNQGVKELGLSLRSKGISLDQITIEDTSSPEPGSVDADAGADRDARSGDQQSHRDGHTQHDGGHGLDNESAEDLTQDEPDSIWTELGLDATA